MGRTARISIRHEIGSGHLSGSPACRDPAGKRRLYVFLPSCADVSMARNPERTLVGAAQSRTARDLSSDGARSMPWRGRSSRRRRAAPSTAIGEPTRSAPTGWPGRWRPAAALRKAGCGGSVLASWTGWRRASVHHRRPIVSWLLRAGRAIAASAASPCSGSAGMSISGTGPERQRHMAHGLRGRLATLDGSRRPSEALEASATGAAARRLDSACSARPRSITALRCFRSGATGAIPNGRNSSTIGASPICR